jgi:hypothetical protein
MTDPNKPLDMTDLDNFYFAREARRKLTVARPAP